MGAQASKPVVKPPEDWERHEVRRPFEVISPCSDISNPSDFNRVRYHRQTQEYQLVPPPPPHQRQRQRQPSFNRDGAAEESTPFDPNRPLQRRVSNKSNSSSSNNAHNLPVAVKVQRSNSTGGQRSTTTRNDRTSGEILAPGAFYFPTKESERRAERVAKKALKSDHREIAPQLASKHKDDKNRNIVSSMKENVINVDMKQKTKFFRRGARKAAKKMKKKKDAIKRIALAVATACFEETKSICREEEIAPYTRTERQLNTTQDLATYPSERKFSNSQRRTRRRSEIIAPGDIKATTSRKEEVIQSKLKRDYDLKKENCPGKQERHQNELERVTSIALHQEDIYFDRLSLSPSAQHGASPFVQNSSNRVTSLLDIKKPDPESTANVQCTPLNRRRMSVDTPMDTPISDLFSASDSLPQERDHDYLIASIKNQKNNISPVSSLMRFYTKTGPMESSPKSYCSDEDEDPVKVFTDEQSDDSSQRRSNEGLLARNANRRQSQESQSSLYTVESKTYKKINGTDLKLLAHNDEVLHVKEIDTLSSYIQSAEKKEDAQRRSTKKNKSKQGKPKVSKLESLFRPILPALSTDDAQSMSSYDKYEIKVTESAPGMIQAGNHISLGVRRSSSSSGSSMKSKTTAGSTRPSMSVLSIDSQRKASLSTNKHMVSSQANSNSEFLFTDDYGPIAVARNPNQRRSSGGFTISTAEARSRLTQKSTGIAIPIRTVENGIDDISVDNSSLKSERRVRFSGDSVHLLSDYKAEVSKDKDNNFVEETPHDEVEGREMKEDVGEAEDAVTYPEDEKPELESTTRSSFSRFQHEIGAGVRRTDSVAESIDLPEVENKMTQRRSLESVRSIRSSNSFPDSIPEEEAEDNEVEEDTTESSPDSVHWTYTKNGVTPYVPGKSAANPTKSPFFRYQHAKTKFNTDHPIGPKKSPKKIPKISPKKSPAKILRKGSGGLVSVRIQELNNRVSEVRKLKRMRKKMTNPRLHTHNFDNTQPVRNRALINYKTNIGSADLEKSNNLMAAKFNMIPDVYDYDDDDDNESTFSAETNHNSLVASDKIVDDDDASRMSEMTGVTSIATIRQQRNSRGISMSSRSTTSSGLSNLKKQVFRASEGTNSVVSISDSTTMSSIIHKENENYLPFRSTSTVVKPSEQHFGAPQQALRLTPSKGTPAMKWRSLAAAAAEKDALKASAAKPRKGLAVRSVNNAYHYR